MHFGNFGGCGVEPQYGAAGKWRRDPAKPETQLKYLG